MKNKEKFLELIKNDDFLNTILNLETLEEMQAKFLENEVEVSISEVSFIRKIVDTIIAKGTIELSQDDLDKIVENAVALSKDDLDGVVGGEFTGDKALEEVYKRSIDNVVDYVMRKVFTGLDTLFGYTVEKIKNTDKKRSKASPLSTSATKVSQDNVSR